MKRVARLIVLVILLGVAGLRLTIKLGPWVTNYLENRKSKKVDVEMEAQTRASQVPPMSRLARLADGSFNPIPPVKAAVTDDPSTLVARLQWRERYMPYLKASAPAAGGPAFYVYPFLDRTPEGVGLHFTYGWHLTGAAALAQWTDARLTGSREPRHYGLPLPEESDPQKVPDFAEWTRRALEDPAAQEARYVVVGVYDYDKEAKKYRLEIKLLDREQPAAARDLVTSASTPRGSLLELAAAQRSAARQMAEAVVRLGLARARTAPDVKALKLETELGEVACLLDGADSWAMMEGIDRALALARLFPGETLPLQAAVYGINAMAWAYLSYGTWNTYEYDMRYRAWALGQVALAMDERPLLNRLNWAYAAIETGNNPQRCLGPLTDPQLNLKAPELAAYRDVMLFNHTSFFSHEEATLLPAWQNLWKEMAKSWFIYNAGDRRLWREGIKVWPFHDLYLQAIIHGSAKRYEYGNMADLGSLMPAASHATAGTLAAELAAVLTALGPGLAADALLDGLAVPQGETGEKLSREQLGKLVAARDYYRLRQTFTSFILSRDSSFSSDSFVFHLLGEMEKTVPEVLNDPQCTAGVTGWEPFEFTPARRVQFAAWRDLTGPALIAEQMGDRLGSYEGLMEVLKGMLHARPSNPNGHRQCTQRLERYTMQPEAGQLMDHSKREADRLHPLEPGVLFSMGYLEAYARSLPFNKHHSRELGQHYRSIGYHARAVKYLTEYCEEYPERYDIANERAWSLCQMGKFNDPAVRKTFATPGPLLAGNFSFHMDNLNYLVYWAEDYKEARNVARFYQRFAGGRLIDPVIWMATIERLDGKTTAALEMLNTATMPVPQDPLERAENYAQMAGAYLDLGRPELAEPWVIKAARTDSWKGSVIMIMARLALEKGQYDKAMEEYQRCLERYGFSTDAVLGIATCLEKQGKKDEAVKLLEEKLQGDERNELVRIKIRLMRLYEEGKQPEKIKPLMELILKAPNRTRGSIADALVYYKKVEPQEGEAIWKRIDQIMAGPEG